MKSVVRAICGFLLIVVSWGEAAAELNDPECDIERILARKKLVVALLNRDYPPLFITEESGQLAGSDISLVRSIAGELGVKVEFVRRAHTFDEIVDMVARGKADIGLSTTITLQRARKVAFSEPYLVLKMALLLNRLRMLDDGIRSTPTDFSHLSDTTQRIGLLKGSAYWGYAEEMFPKAQLIEYDSLEQLREAVVEGELLAAVRNDLTERLFLQRNPGAALQVDLFVDESTEDHLAFSVNPACPHLLTWLNTYIVIKDVRKNSNQLVDTYESSQEGRQQETRSH